MGEYNLNLSTRPFPAYRVANAGLVLFFLLVAGVSGWQLYSYRFFAGRAKINHTAEENTQVEKKALGETLDKLTSSLDRPVTTAKLTEIDYLNDLIVRKHFSWTQVFANLEGVIPDNVHLVSISVAATTGSDKDPKNKAKEKEKVKDSITLRFETVCRSISDESEFIRQLQASPVFQDVVVAREEEKDQKGPSNSGDINVDMTVSYFPQRAAQ